MKKTKLSFLIMVIFMLLLAACTSKETGGNTEKPPVDKEPEKTEDPVEPDEEEVTYDLGGRVIRIGNHWDLTPVGGTELGDLAVQKVKEVEEKYNVKIEWPVVSWDDKISLLTTSIIGGEPMADIMGIDSNQAAALVQQDYIYALDDLIDLSATKMTQPMIDAGKFNGKLYLFRSEINESGGMFYNKTLFEQAGLADPYELQEKGEWTWDAMLEAAKKLTNGTTYGLSGEGNLLAEYSVATNNAQFLNTDTGEFVMDSPNAMEGLEFMAALFNEHKVVKPNEGSTWNDPRQYFTEGLVGMTQGWVWEAEGRLDAPFEWGYVFWPKGPKADDYVTVVSSVGGYVIPKGVKDPEIVYQIWEDLQLFMEENVIEWFETVLPNEESVNTAILMNEKIFSNYWSAYNLSDAFWGTFYEISSGSMSPAQAIAAVKPNAQARVDLFMGKIDAMPEEDDGGDEEEAEE